MAIIDTRGGGGVQVLIETLLNKERLAQQKEALKLQQGEFQMQKEKFMFEQEQARQANEAANVAGGLFGATPQQMQQAMQGADPALRGHMLPLLIGMQQAQAQTARTEAETLAIQTDVEEQISTFDARQRLMEAETAVQELEVARRTGEPTAIQEFTENTRRANEELALARRQAAVAESQANTAKIATLSELRQIMPGAFALLNIPLNTPEEEREAETQGELNRLRISRSATLIGLDANNSSALLDAYDDLGDDPTALARHFFEAEDLDEATKAAFYSAIQATFPTISLEIPEEIKRNNIFRRALAFIGNGLVQSLKNNNNSLPAIVQPLLQSQGSR